MRAQDQLSIIMEAIKEAEREGKKLDVAQARRKLHREYITRQLWNKWGTTPAGMLIKYGFKSCEDDRHVADAKLLGVFDRYLSCENKLTGRNGLLLRSIMDRLDIDYLNSPTYPLEPLDQPKAV